MYELLLAGGWLMLPLGLCSLLMLAIILEKTYQLHLSPSTANNKIKSLENLTQLSPQHLAALPLGRIYLAGQQLLTAAKPAKPKQIKQAMLQAGTTEIHRLEHRLNLLGTLTSIAPLLGLLGTVVGMIDIFTQLDLTQNNAQALAGGIGVALITTATGLTLAIPGLIMHRHFLRRLDTLVLQLETASQALFSQLISLNTQRKDEV